MHVVVPDQLWQGNAADGRDAKALFAANIALVIDLAKEEPPASLPRDIAYCRIPLYDGAGNDVALLNLSVTTLHAALAGGLRTLVVCSAGMSRSPSVVAVALSELKQCPAEEVLSLLTETQPHDISPAFWQELLASRNRDH